MTYILLVNVFFNICKIIFVYFNIVFRFDIKDREKFDNLDDKDEIEKAANEC